MSVFETFKKNSTSEKFYTNQEVKNKKKGYLYTYMAVLQVMLCFLVTGCAIKGDGEPRISEEAQLYNEAVDNFFAAVDARDKDAIREMFAPSVQKSNAELDSQIEKLLETYPGPTDICKRNGNLVTGSYFNEFGTKSAEVDDGFPVVSNGAYYWCEFKLMYRNDWDEDEIGIKDITFYSAEYRCAQLNESNIYEGSIEKGIEEEDYNGLHVLTDISVDYEVRFIGGYPEKYTPIERTLTKEQVEDFFETSDSYLTFKEQFGEPNVEGGSGVSYIYELPQENGEPRYLDLLVDDDGIILSARIQNDLDDEAVSEIWNADD